MTKGWLEEFPVNSILFTAFFIYVLLAKSTRRSFLEYKDNLSKLNGIPV